MECGNVYCNGTLIEVSVGQYQCNKCKRKRYVSFDVKREIAGVS